MSESDSDQAHEERSSEHANPREHVREMEEHLREMGEYVRRLRIEFATRALLTSDVSLAAVAQAAGFADQGHFTRAFKAATGYTPGAYRRLAGQ